MIRRGGHQSRKGFETRQIDQMTHGNLRGRGLTLVIPGIALGGATLHVSVVGSVGLDRMGEPKAVIVLCGKRKCGKDYVAEMLARM